MGEDETKAKQEEAAELESNRKQQDSRQDGAAMSALPSGDNHARAHMYCLFGQCAARLPSAAA